MASTVDCSNSPRLNAFFFFKVKHAPCEADSLQVDSDSDIEMEEAKSREKPAGEAAKPTMETPMATPTTPMATPTTPMATPRATPTTEDVQRQLHELQQKYAELLARQPTRDRKLPQLLWLELSPPRRMHQLSQDPLRIEQLPWLKARTSAGPRQVTRRICTSFTTWRRRMHEQIQIFLSLNCF